MARIIIRIARLRARSLIGVPRYMLVANVQLWRHTFWQAWEPLPWDAKFAWVMFMTHTIALVTAIEMFAIR